VTSTFVVVNVSWFFRLSLFSWFSLTIIFTMPQPKWYHKSLSELCMDSIVDNMEKWTASRSLVHVSTPFYLLRECHFCGIIGYYYLSISFSLHAASHCLEYIIQCLEEDRRLKEEMFDLLINPHSKVLDLSKNAFVSTEKGVKRYLRIVSLASVRCSVIIISSLLCKRGLMNNFL
jgi:hypothetical protein